MRIVTSYISPLLQHPLALYWTIDFRSERPGHICSCGHAYMNSDNANGSFSSQRRIQKEPLSFNLGGKAPAGMHLYHCAENPGNNPANERRQLERAAAVSARLKESKSSPRSQPRRPIQLVLSHHNGKPKG